VRLTRPRKPRVGRYSNFTERFGRGVHRSTAPVAAGLLAGGFFDDEPGKVAP
jgi:hypothetical protein